ncbi:MAG: hypothetical protein HUK20_12160 [Fibrobacter sp.]|nr:hypothetical protein [Fibrobacter sp.]
MKAFILLFLAMAGFASGQSVKYLHVSTIPGNADIYVGSTAPDYGNAPHYTSPSFIPVEEDHVLLALFKPEFVDTLLDVNIPSHKDTSYIIVSLKQSYDNAFIDKQNSFIAKRARRKAGSLLKWTSIAPFVASALSASVTMYHIGKANDAKKILDNSKIANGKNFNQAKEDFSDYRSYAKTGKNISIGTLAGGVLLLTTGFILSF